MKQEKEENDIECDDDDGEEEGEQEGSNSNSQSNGIEAVVASGTVTHCYDF